MPIPLSKMRASSFDNAVTMTNASSNVCTTVFVTTLLIVLVKPYVSLKPISDSFELSRKMGHSGSLSSVSCDDVGIILLLYGIVFCCWILFVIILFPVALGSFLLLTS